jgi:ATP-binding cassette subfamily B multidrug efflux pump
MNKRPFKTSRFISSFARHHWGLSLLLILAILGTSLSGLLPAFALRYIIDQEIQPALNAGTLPETGRLIGLSLLFYGCYFLEGLFTIFENFMIDVYGEKLIHELRYLMLEKSARLRLSYFSKHGSGEMSSRLTDDVYAIELLFSEGLVSLLVSLAKIIGIWVSIFVFNWVLGLLLFAVVPLIALITHLFRKGMLKAQIANRKVLNEESNHFAETIDNLRLLKDLGKEPYRESNFKGLLGRAYQSQNKTALFDSFYSPTIDFIKAIVIALLTLVVAYSYNNSTLVLGLSIGTFAASIDLISSIFAPIQAIGEELQSMQEGVSGIYRVESFLNEEEISPKDSALTAGKVLTPKAGTPLLRFEDLSFHYDDGTELIFDHLSFDLPAKQQVCVIGRTGAGKTTLFRLTLGLLEPTGGALLLNGNPVQAIPDTEKRQIFGYVEQGFKPVPGTLRDQVTLGDPTISEEAVKAALSESFLFDYVKVHLPNGLDTPFHSDDFSRGQLQLLGLARAIVTDPSILLLDEISANLDSATEQQVIQAITRARQSRTVLSISHRLSDQLGFNKIIEVENGHAIAKQ